MKKLGLFVFILTAFSCAVSFAQALQEDQHWVEEVGGSVAFPTSGDASKTYSTGFCGHFSVGYRISPNISESVMTGYYQFNLQKPAPGSSGDFSYVPLMEVTRVTLGDGPFRPYAFFGLGMAFNTIKLTSAGQTNSTTETDLLLSPGAGLFWSAFPQAALFVQGRLDANFVSNSNPANHNDSPTVFMPLEAGVAFYLL